jgi:hypothetical protein
MAILGCGVDERAITARPSPIMIDTFEDDSLIPNDPRFNRWGSVVFGTDLATREYKVTGPGFDSDWSLQLSWEFSDPPDGSPNYPDALIRTQALGSVDLTHYETFSFAQRYQPGTDTSCPALKFMRVSLGCSELGVGFHTILAIASDWTVASLPLAEFAEPTWAFTGTSWQDCLSEIDEIDFVTWYGLADGECASGTLWLDDIVIR